MQFQRVGITSKPHKPEIKQIVPELLEWLEHRGIEVLVDKETGANLETAGGCCSRAEVVSKSDLVIVLGGDGTLLATARAVGGKPVPILAVNLGGLGFLTVVTLEELYPALEMTLAGEYTIDQRVRIESEVRRNGEIVSSFLALNDVVLNKGAIARVLDFDVCADGQFISTYKSDGLIVSTPTGSTAYSLAAGGPVVVPAVNSFIVTPICAHTLTNRSIVLPDSVTLDITMKHHQESVYVTIDGQVAIALRSNDHVRVKRSNFGFNLVQPPQKSYFDVLRQKLKWGER